MIAEDVRAEILRRISAAEREHGVRVILAVESGSRAWGFESPNSDYDARFIYVHEPDWYLSIDPEARRDVVEYPIVDEIDLNGWDVRKALRLFARSNPTFVEWIQSPIVYIERGGFAAAARRLLPDVYSCARGIHHYRSMARTTFRNHLKADPVSLKKYFYVLRPLLSVRWLERYSAPAPIEFRKLLPLIDGEPALAADIDRLLETKRAASQAGLLRPVASIHAFIERELERLETIAPPVDADGPMDRLNEVFRAAIRE